MTYSELTEEIIDYTNELDEEIKRVEQWLNDNIKESKENIASMMGRWNALTEVRNDFRNRFE